MEILRELRWKLEIGDPTILGWFTVATYFLTALLAARVWHRQRDWVWILVALGLTALGLNKQLDLQSLFTDIGRVASHHLGWYEVRRGVQKWFVLGVIAGSGAFGAWFVWHRHAFWTCHKLLSSGLALLAVFVLLRMMTFYHFEALSEDGHLTEALNLTLELGGILLVFLAALRENHEK